MSDRLISADKAKEVLKHLLYETAMNNDIDIAEIYEDIAENRLETWIELIPTVDAEPVRHGHWVDEGKKFLPIYCSRCGFGKVYEDQRNYAYCPNCGVKMDEHIDTPTDPVAK